MLGVNLDTDSREAAVQRIHVAALLALAVAVPVAGSHFLAGARKPCFIAGDIGYQLSDGKADFTIRIDNAAADPDLRLQLASNAATADFVLIDDSASAGACSDAKVIRSFRLDPQASHPDLTVALSHEPAAHKIYVQSAAFSQQDAAALFAVIWRNESKTAGSIRQVAIRN